MENLSTLDTEIYIADVNKMIREYSKEYKAYLLKSGKVLVCIFKDKSSILFSSLKAFEELENKTVFLKLGDARQLIGFELLEPNDLILVEQIALNPLGRYCEGESFELPNGLIYIREDYGRHGYIFMNKHELQLYCSEWVEKHFR